MPTEPTTFTTDDQVKGIDVSHNNGTIDWQKVAAAGVSFAFAKATEGDDFSDPKFSLNCEGIQSSGIICGAYHFFRPGQDAGAQADNFLKVVQGQDSRVVLPALDVEVNDSKDAGNIIAGVQAWMDAVAESLNCRPILYTSASFWNLNVGGSGQFSAYPLWVAHYTFNSKPNIPTGFSDYAIWQFTEDGAIDGIAGNVDFDRYNGSLDDLRKLAGF